MMLQDHAVNLTYKVELPGGQSRLKEAAIYIASRCEHLTFFGLVKLNKMLWRADFRAFLMRRVPVTGRTYQRLPQGPAPWEMSPLLNDLLRANLMRIVSSNIPHERRPIATVKPDLRYFTEDDLSFLDEAIEHYRLMTGTETSDSSHGTAWKTHADGEMLPYESAYFDDRPLPDEAIARFSAMARERGWRSN